MPRRGLTIGEIGCLGTVQSLELAEWIFHRKLFRRCVSNDIAPLPGSAVVLERFHVKVRRFHERLLCGHSSTLVAQAAIKPRLQIVKEDFVSPPHRMAARFQTATCRHSRRTQKEPLVESSGSGNYQDELPLTFRFHGRHLQPHDLSW